MHPHPLTLTNIHSHTHTHWHTQQGGGCWSTAGPYWDWGGGGQGMFGFWNVCLRDNRTWRGHALLVSLRSNAKTRSPTRERTETKTKREKHHFSSGCEGPQNQSSSVYQPGDLKTSSKPSHTVYQYTPSLLAYTDTHTHTYLRRQPWWNSMA